MKEQLDIEKLLYMAAPPAPDISENGVEQVYTELARSTAPVKRATILVVGIYFLLAFLGSLFLMVAVSIPWWGIALSFGSTFGLAFALWYSAKAVLF